MAKQRLDDMIADQPGHGSDDVAQPEDAVEQAAPRTVYTSGKTYDSAETITPRLVLAQQLSPEVRAKQADSGEWLVMGHKPQEAVTVVIAGHASKRRYVPANADKASCYSPDAVYGYGNPGTLPDGTHLACEECPLSKWSDSGRKDASGKTINNPPPCNEIDEFVAYSVTHGMPVFLPLKGTGAKAARFIKTLCNGLGEGNFAIRLNATEKQGKGRAWYEPVVTIDDEVSQDEANAYAMIARRAANASAAALPANAEATG